MEPSILGKPQIMPELGRSDLLVIRQVLERSLRRSPRHYLHVEAREGSGSNTIGHNHLLS